MKTDLKPATAAARALFKKLHALAERGIGGEKSAAQKKLARLMARFDFSAPDPTAKLDLFSGRFTPASKARRIHSFAPNELDVANSVKWAIETAAHIPCVFRNGELLAEASASTANRLTQISAHIAGCFRTLVDQFGAVDGINAQDRGVFVMGLYDGMMNETRNVGERLPNRPDAVKKRKTKKRAAAPTGTNSHGPGINIHPYSVGLDLGRQIRFSAPLAQVAAELDAVLQKHIGPSAGR